MADITITRIDDHTLAFTGLTEAVVREVVRFGANADEEPVSVHAEPGRVIVKHREPAPQQVWF